MKTDRAVMGVLLCCGLLLGPAQAYAMPEAARASDAAVTANQTPEVSDFYSATGAERVWFDAQGEPRLVPQQELEAWVLLSYEHGLRPQDYGAQSFLDGLDSRLSLSEREQWFTEQFLALARDLAGSDRVAQADSQWHFEVPVLDTTALSARLRRGESVAEILQSLLPQSPEYWRLVELYRQELKLPPDSIPPPILPQRLLRPGDQHDAIPILVHWLIQQSRLDADQVDRTSRRYSEPVVEAVRHIQRQNGLQADGIIGPDTRQAILQGREQRLRQIRANLFRWRALPRQLGSRYLLVRTAAFNLDLIKDGELERRHAVIAGRPSRPTPSFAASVRRLTFNPYWTVPFRIAVEDLLPKQQEDSAYLSSHQIDVLERSDEARWEARAIDSIDWSALSRGNFNLLLRQRPGPLNSLGRVRMDMPNPYSIFLHDTPQKRLFDEMPRAYSSGCVRVQDIDVLVSTLMDQAQVEKALAQSDTRPIALQAPVPVYLVYLTAWVDEQGVAYLHPDLYGRDRKLDSVLGPIGMPPPEYGVELARKVIKK
ncbi:L,D-transpeptidase family protein [Marinobacterium sp. AK62]|uniref:L,D-transpeptidase family protein n=1 Tax=Marinobacterium alkalitolerans TaxID=1542925 RepID=A0ABS3Z913_9GAMM|nr:L,D-transpeptidase family protein [Marinobacterium alkalitolerans]MBP0048201.1 L,D-transpeptidase family protein [Marinobacterium alkalitolerans]